MGGCSVEDNTRLSSWGVEDPVVRARPGPQVGFVVLKVFSLSDGWGGLRLRTGCDWGRLFLGRDGDGGRLFLGWDWGLGRCGNGHFFYLHWANCGLGHWWFRRCNPTYVFLWLVGVALNWAWFRGVLWSPENVAGGSSWRYRFLWLSWSVRLPKNSTTLPTWGIGASGSCLGLFCWSKNGGGRLIGPS